MGRQKRGLKTRNGANVGGSSDHAGNLVNFIDTSQFSHSANSAFHDESAMGSAITTSSYSDQCPLCNIHLGSANLYQRHMNECHKEDGMLPFTCDLCQHGFFSLSGLRYHQQTHGGQRYSCFVCDAKLKHKSTVRRHMEAVHFLKECRYCEKYFKQGPEFNVHIVSCTPKK